MFRQKSDISAFLDVFPKLSFNGLKKNFAWSFSESVTGSSVDYCTVFTGLKQPFFSLTEGWSLDTLCARGLFKL